MGSGFTSHASLELKLSSSPPLARRGAPPQALGFGFPPQALGFGFPYPKIPRPGCRPAPQALEYHKLLGRCVAKALQDSRLMDLPLNYAFYRAVLARPLDMQVSRELRADMCGRG